MITTLLCAFTSKIQASTPDFPQNENFLCGDVNQDGIVNVLDIISMVNYIMGNDPSPFNEDAADVNADGWINVLDVMALVNIIMQVPGLPCSCLPAVTYEGQSYATVLIGTQCWMAENLNVGTMITSTSGGVNRQIMTSLSDIAMKMIPSIVIPMADCMNGLKRLRLPDDQCPICSTAPMQVAPPSLLASS